LQSLSEDSGVPWDSNSQSGSSLGSVRVHSLTLSYTPRSMRCDSMTSLLAHNLASLCLVCKHKVRVATFFEMVGKCGKVEDFIFAFAQYVMKLQSDIEL